MKKINNVHVKSNAEGCFLRNDEDLAIPVLFARKQPQFTPRLRSMAELDRRWVSSVQFSDCPGREKPRKMYLFSFRFPLF
jgi:hypothetical protein